MAQKYILLTVLWISVAIVGIVSQSTSPPAGPATSESSTSTNTTESPPVNSTTASATSPSVTEGPPVNSTTANATSPSATESPPVNSTTASATSPSATEGPTVNSTTANATSPSATESPPVNSTTANATSPSATETSPTAPTTAPPAPCDSSPCGDGSTCNNFGPDNFTCSCLTGDTYDYISQSCMKAKIFPGQLSVPGIDFNPRMSDETSQEFRDAAQNITIELRSFFIGTEGYTESRVLKITERTARTSGVIASVENIFEASSGVTLNNVTSVMETASNCSSCLLKGSSFTERDLCNEGPCDTNTTKCTPSDGTFTCECQTGFIRTTHSSTICIACLSGFKAEGPGCVKCPFGYSGFNCEENWKLLLVIIGSVLGGLLLICLILLPVVALKCSKKSSKKRRDADIGKPYITHSSAKSPLANSFIGNSQAVSLNGSANGLTNTGAPRIPRATTNSTWDSRANLEMIPSHSRQNLISEGKNSRPFDDEDEISPYGLSRQNSQYSQRPQSNPYGQTRAQFNPYAQKQGHSNPYYLRDGGR